MARHERDILERAVRVVADQARNASAIADELTTPASTDHILWPGKTPRPLTQ